MAISVNCATKVITIPQADLTPVSGSLYELDVNWFRQQLKDWEDSEEGIVMPNTHNHNAPVTLSGVTFARTLEIINGYTVTFENGSYSVRCVGANHNLGDVKTVNSVSLIIGNAAGLIAVNTGGGGEAPTAGQNADAVWAKVIEAGLSAEQVVRAVMAVLLNNATGLGSALEQFRDRANAKTRLTSTVDEAGNRSVTVNDLS